MSLRGRSQSEPRSPFCASAARIAAQTCLQVSPPAKKGQEQNAQRLAPSRVSETWYSSVPETDARATSGPHSVSCTRSVWK